MRCVEFAISALKFDKPNSQIGRKRANCAGCYRAVHIASPRPDKGMTCVPGFEKREGAQVGTPTRENLHLEAKEVKNLYLYKNNFLSAGRMNYSLPIKLSAVRTSPPRWMQYTRESDAHLRFAWVVIHNSAA